MLHPALPDQYPEDSKGTLYIKLIVNRKQKYQK